MKGIDISIFQGHIDFAKVKASGIEVVIIKATQGTGYTNAMLKEHYNGAKSNGLKIGFYHYLTKDNPTTQAKQFLSVIDGLIANCKYIIDVEDGDPLKGGHVWTITEASKATREFADYLISKGKEVAIYTGDYFYRDSLNNTVKDLSLWVASYGGSLMAKNYVGQQTTNEGIVNGIIGHVDLDTFNNGILLTSKVTAKSISTGVVTADMLFVRDSPSPTATKLGRLAKGTVVKIDKKVGNWYSIYYGTSGGYVSADYIK